MSWRRAPAWTYGALCAASAAALNLGAEWNRRLVLAPRHGQIVFGQGGGGEQAAAVSADAGDPRTWQKIEKLPEIRKASYGFVDFKQDRITLSYQVPEAEFQRYNSAYGYLPGDVTALQRWRDNATQSSYRLAVASGKSQAQVNAAAAAIQKEYLQKLRDYLQSRGFLLEPGGVTRIDMPAVVRRNGPLAKPIAQVFDRFATSHGYQSMDIVGAVLSFAQTAVEYKEPADVYKGKHTGGILPPITTVVLGWGDCDTKTGMTASILSNWDQMRMVGISVPGHYLMGVLQIPDKGDLFVEYQGLQYILLEPAGPGWFPPGQVAEETVAQLNAADGYKMYPFF
jgi:hypothetical protein